MENMRATANAIIDTHGKLDALITAADAMATDFEATEDTKEEFSRFLNLFYMAVDMNKELKALVRAL